MIISSAISFALHCDVTNHCHHHVESFFASWCFVEAFLQMPRDAAEDVVKIRGNQRQVDHAEELLQESLFLNFTFIKLRLSKHFKHDVLIGKNGVHVRSIKGERDVDIQFEDQANSSLLCVVSGKPDDCVAVCEEILIRMSRCLR